MSLYLERKKRPRKNRWVELLFIFWVRFRSYYKMTCRNLAFTTERMCTPWKTGSQQRVLFLSAAFKLLKKPLQRDVQQKTRKIPCSEIFEVQFPPTLKNHKHGSCTWLKTLENIYKTPNSIYIYLASKFLLKHEYLKSHDWFPSVSWHPSRKYCSHASCAHIWAWWRWSRGLVVKWQTSNSCAQRIWPRLTRRNEMDHGMNL